MDVSSYARPLMAGAQCSAISDTDDLPHTGAVAAGLFAQAVGSNERLHARAAIDRARGLTTYQPLTNCDSCNAPAHKNIHHRSQARTAPV
jgi:hypothetical protein